MRKAFAILTAVALLAAPVQATPVDGAQTYDLLFRNGTLDDISRDTTLVYSRSVSNALKPEAAERDTGAIALSFHQGQALMAKLEFRQDGKHKGLGAFPASVGNPMIMYFYESVVRDMAEAAGGSPFYIRNRVKESLIQPSDVEEGEAVYDGRTVRTRTIRLYPFAEDPNRADMQGFGDLELSVTMSDDVPGWYLELVAEAKGGANPIYRSMMRFDGMEATE